jgi:hypothetical protein
MKDDVRPNRDFVVHARQMFSPGALREVRRYFDDVTTKNVELAKTDREQQAVARGESADSVRLDRRWFDVWASPSERLLGLLKEYTWVLYPPQVRHVKKVGDAVPWHQDAGYSRLLGARRHPCMATCFLPLDEDPARRTTLQFVLNDTGRVELDHQPMAGFGAGVDQPDGKLVHYDLEIGDCLFFGDLAVHRTFRPDDCIADRRSLEFRLTKPQDAIRDKDYFCIPDGKFVQVATAGSA